MNKEQLGERAKQILDDPVYQLAMGSLKDTIFNAFRQAKIDDYDAIKDMHLLMRAADIFESKLQTLVNDAVAEIANKQKGNIKKIKRG